VGRYPRSRRIQEAEESKKKKNPREIIKVEVLERLSKRE
jgi:hypothetical protein